MDLFKKISMNKKVILMLNQGVFSGTSFLVTIILAHLFAPEVFGVFASVILFIYLLISILNSLVIQPLQVSMARVEDIKSYISFSFWVQLLISVILSSLIWLILNTDIPVLKEYNHLAWPVIGLTTTMVMHDYFRKLFLACNKIQRALIIDISSAIFYGSALVISYLSPIPKLDHTMIYFSFGYLPGIIWSIIAISPGKVRKNDLLQFSKMHYQQSKWLLLTALVQWWSTNLFVVASGLFIGLKALGAFRLVQSIFGVFNMLLQTFENYVLPQTSRLIVSSIEEARIYLKNISMKTSLFAGLILVLTFVFAEPIIIFAGGSKYAEYSFVVRGMVILYGLIFFGYPIRMAIRAMLLNRHYFIAYLISLIASLISFSYLLEKFELIGALTGLIISQLVLIIYWQTILTKRKLLLWK